MCRIVHRTVGCILYGSAVLAQQLRQFLHLGEGFRPCFIGNGSALKQYMHEEGCILFHLPAAEHGQCIQQIHPCLKVSDRRAALGLLQAGKNLPKHGLIQLHVNGKGIHADHKLFFQLIHRLRNGSRQLLVVVIRHGVPQNIHSHGAAV